MDDREQRIRDRAYHLWLEEGQPDGRANEYWERAACEIGLEEPEVYAMANVPAELDSTETTL